MDTTLEQEEQSSALRYVLVWVGLVILTIATFALFRLDLGPWHLIVALAIAVSKSALVVLFFMHLWDHSGAPRLVLATAMVFVLLLIGLCLADTATRFPLANPPTGQSEHGRPYRHTTDADVTDRKVQPPG